MRRILFLAVFTLFSLKTYAQQPIPAATQAAISAELKKRGLAEEEVRKRLIEKGIDVDNVRMEDLPRVQKQIEEVIAELEREKEQAKNKDNSTPEDFPSEYDEDTETEQTQDTKKKTARTSEENDENTTDESRNGNATPKKKPKNDPSVSDETEKNPRPTPTRPNRNVDARPVVARKMTKDSLLFEALYEAAKDSLDSVKVYGADIFKNNKLEFVDDKKFRAPDSYVLGIGDKITVSITGVAYYNQTLELVGDGFIQPERMPRIFLKGMTLGKAKQILQASYRNFYPFNREEFYVSVYATRQVAVNIVGEVTNPGTFKVSASNSAFNALVKANGPTEIGSLRNIQLIRATGEKKRMDVYEFLLDPSVAKDFYLFDNDYISVPVAERVVSVIGAVKRPFRYELIKGENLVKAIQFAGGLSDNAVQTRLQIRRFVNDKERIIDVNFKDLKEKGTDFELLNGDRVVVKAITTTYENYAGVAGAVEQPGNYEITEGSRVSDLLGKAVLKREAKTDLAYLQRTNPDKTLQLRLLNLDEILKNPNSETNLKLQPLDRLVVFSQERFAQKDSVTVRGAVRKELRYPFDPTRSMRVSDLVNLAGGLRNDATDFAYIIRKDIRNSKLAGYVRVNLRAALERPNTDENISLQPNDELRIQSRITFIDSSNVRVTGAVRQPGEFKWDETLTLRDVLTLSGGLRTEAATNRIDIFRIQFNGNNPSTTAVTTVEIDKDFNVISGDPNFQLRPYDKVVVRSIPEFSYQKVISITGEIRYPGQYALLSKNERITSIIQRAGGLSVEAFPAGATLYRIEDNIGYVVFKLEDALRNPLSNHNIVLKEGDIIEVPKTKDIVTIQGATQATDLYPDKILQSGKINVAFQGRKSAWYYVDNFAAGVGKDGRKRLISVEHPNGEIKRTKDFFLFKVYPKVEKGDVINVGYVERKLETDKKKSERKEIDWSKVLADSIAQATALLSFILLIQRLN